MIKEIAVKPMSGWGPLLAFVAFILGGPVVIVVGATSNAVLIPVGILLIVSALLMLFGFQAVAPNQARVLLLFGAYRGLCNIKLARRDGPRRSTIETAIRLRFPPSLCGRS